MSWKLHCNFYRVGFKETKSTDMTTDFIEILKREMVKFEGMKDEFIQVKKNILKSWINNNVKYIYIIGIFWKRLQWPDGRLENQSCEMQWRWTGLGTLHCRQALNSNDNRYRYFSTAEQNFTIILCVVALIQLKFHFRQLKEIFYF